MPISTYVQEQGMFLEKVLFPLSVHMIPSAATHTAVHKTENVKEILTPVIQVYAGSSVRNIKKFILGAKLFCPHPLIS